MDTASRNTTSSSTVAPRRPGRRLLAAAVALCLPLLGATVASAGPPDDAFLVKDIWPGALSSIPQQLFVLGDIVFLRAADNVSGSELWRSDGTEAGTFMVKDINPGAGSSFAGGFAAVGETLFFAADDGVKGDELWRSDGTEAGTVMVKDINEGAGDSFPYELVDFGGTLFFAADDGTNGFELWRSDGTEDGTVMVKDINPGADRSEPFFLTVVGDTLVFVADDGTNGFELWESDGTEDGTVMVKNIRPGGHSVPQDLTAVGDTLFFSADDGDSGRELWRTDPDEGAVLVKDINPGASSSSPRHLTALGDTLYFSANDGVSSRELWRSDGTEAGTFMVKDIWPGASGSFPKNLVAVGDLLYFAADDGTTGDELWRSDGTEAGTEMVKDIRPGAISSDLARLTVVGDMLFFSADDGINGFELWRSDGTEAGTFMVKDIRPGAIGSVPSNLVAVGGRLFFTANDGTNGEELWVAVDTIPPVTTIVSGPVEGSASSDASPVFGFSSDDPPSTFACRLYAAGDDPPGFGACSGPGDTHTPAAPLADGAYVFEVRATDAAGNTDPTPATRTFTVDTVPPVTTIDAGPGEGSTITSRTPTLAFSADEPATFACRLFAAGGEPPAFGACSGPGDSHTPAALANGDWVFEVRATDLAGNTGAPAVRGFTVNVPPPPPAASPSPSPSPTPVVDHDAAAGERVSTLPDGGQVSAEVPAAVAVTTPNAGPVSIELADAPDTPTAGFAMLGLSVVVSAPPASADDPLVLAFTIHPALLGDTDPLAVVPLRDGTSVPDCADPEATAAAPDPCVAARTVDDDGILAIVVRTSEASTWTFGVPDPSPPDVEVGCPPAGFADVAAGDTHADAIDCAAMLGITFGYPDATYRPAEAVRRDQMASFIIRTLTAAGVALPAAAHGFADLDGNLHADAVGRLAAAGIINGATATSYGPDQPVSRAQMAAFLVRALDWAGATVPAGGGGPFTDTADNPHADAIDAAYQLGLTNGVTPTTYQPANDVRRDQMAAFLTRLHDLL